MKEVDLPPVTNMSQNLLICAEITVFGLKGKRTRKALFSPENRWWAVLGSNQ